MTPALHHLIVGKLAYTINKRGTGARLGLVIYDVCAGKVDSEFAIDSFW